jgi:hypothetical protein
MSSFLHWVPTSPQWSKIRLNLGAPSLQPPRICEDTEPRIPLLNTVVSWTSGLGRRSSCDIPTPKHKRNVTFSVHLWSAAKNKIVVPRACIIKSKKVSYRFLKSVSRHLRMARHNENSALNGVQNRMSSLLRSLLWHTSHTPWEGETDPVK